MKKYCMNHSADYSLFKISIRTMTGTLKLRAFMNNNQEKEDYLFKVK